MSVASIFKHIMEAQWAGILAWVEEKQEESLHLECKVKDRDSESMTDKDWGAIAQAMSGFTNSQGGVYVLGVHARNRGKNFPDQVQSIVPLKNVLKFKGAIQRQILGLTDPPVAGVRVEHIENPEDPTTGVILIYIPASDASTHRTMAGETGIREHYYMRSTASTVLMHHSLLAERFGRRPTSRLYLAVLYSLSRHHCSAEVWIGNAGRGAAERPAVGFVQDPDPQRREHHPDHWWHLLKPAKGWDHVIVTAGAKGGLGCIVKANAETVLYPGMEIPLGFIEDDGRQGPRSSFRLSIHGKLFALNSPPATFGLVRTLEITDTDFPRNVGRVEVPIIATDDRTDGWMA